MLGHTFCLSYAICYDMLGQTSLIFMKRAEQRYIQRFRTSANNNWNHHRRPEDSDCHQGNTSQRTAAAAPRASTKEQA